MGTYHVTFHAVDEVTLTIEAGSIAGAVDKGQRVWKQQYGTPRLRNIQGLEGEVDERTIDHLRQR